MLSSKKDESDGNKTFEVYSSYITVASIISYLSYHLHCCALPDKRCLSHGMLPLSGHDDVALFEWRR